MATELDCLHQVLAAFHEESGPDRSDAFNTLNTLDLICGGDAKAKQLSHIGSLPAPALHRLPYPQCQPFAPSSNASSS